jgi:hypothetical protein
MRRPTSRISSLRVVKITVILARDATKTTVEREDSEAVDTKVGSAEATKRHPGEVHHRLWRTAGTLLAVTTGEDGMTAVEGMADATDVLEEKTNTRDDHCRMCKARSPVVRYKVSLHLHPRRLVRHLHKNGSEALRVVTTNRLTTDVVAAVVAATSEVQDVKTTAT